MEDRVTERVTPFQWHFSHGGCFAVCAGGRRRKDIHWKRVE